MNTRSAFTRSDFALAYMAAFTALGIAPGDKMAYELAEFTHCAEDCIRAVREMATANEFKRVFAALDYLRPIHAAWERSKEQRVAT